MEEEEDPRVEVVTAKGGPWSFSSRARGTADSFGAAGIAGAAGTAGAAGGTGRQPAAAAATVER